MDSLPRSYSRIFAPPGQESRLLVQDLIGRRKGFKPIFIYVNYFRLLIIAEIPAKFKMADALDEELLALAGDSDEEQSPPPQQKDESPAPSRSPHSPDRDLSPETTNRKGQVKGSRRSRKAVRDEEDGEM